MKSRAWLCAWARLSRRAEPLRARSYGTGSGQQSVTGYPDGDDSNSLWVVRPALGEAHPQGTRVSKGMRIRLQHLETRRWLHSHSHLSPLSGRVARAQPFHAQSLTRRAGNKR